MRQYSHTCPVLPTNVHWYSENPKLFYRVNKQYMYLRIGWDHPFTVRLKSQSFPKRPICPVFSALCLSLSNVSWEDMDRTEQSQIIPSTVPLEGMDRNGTHTKLSHPSYPYILTVHPILMYSWKERTEA